MDSLTNTFKAAIRDGRQQIGFWSSIPNPLAIEGLATCGFDWLLIDSEHTALTIPQILGQLQAMAGHATHPVVRVGSLDVVEIKRVLDIGAQSILIPYIQSPEEAHAAVAAVRYPPQGIRGVSGVTRATGFGTVPNYATRANDEICLLLQVETVAALEHIETIAAIDGVDGLFVGPADLAASMGYVGQPSHPEVRKAACDAIRRIRAAGKAAGFLTLDQEVLREVIDAGSNFTAVGIDLPALLGAARVAAAKWKA